MTVTAESVAHQMRFAFCVKYSTGENCVITCNKILSHVLLQMPFNECSIMRRDYEAWDSQWNMGNFWRSSWYFELCLTFCSSMLGSEFPRSILPLWVSPFYTKRIREGSAHTHIHTQNAHSQHESVQIFRLLCKRPSSRWPHNNESSQCLYQARGVASKAWHGCEVYSFPRVCCNV